MKWYLIVLIMFLCSCKQSAIEQKLAVADSLQVQYFDEKGIIFNASTSTEQPAISKIASFLEARSVPPAECTPNGNLRFFSKNGLLLEALYHYGSNTCKYFSFELDGKLYYVGMSNTAEDFLREITPPRFSD